MNLTNDQQNAVDKFKQFLYSDDKELIISGAGGVGKTYVIKYLIDKIIPDYEKTCSLLNIKPIIDNVELTATTNKAAEVLSQETQLPISTIHSILGLTVKNNFRDGSSKLIKNNKWTIHENTLFFIDEASMIDYSLLKNIQESTKDCKIVYVGDVYQLAPIKEAISPVFNKGIQEVHLYEPIRNKNQIALLDICTQLRETVHTGLFKPIKITPGVVDLFDSEDAENVFKQHFINDKHKNRMLTYTNKQTINYNDYIKQIRKYTEPYTVGECGFCGSVIKPNHKTNGFYCEEELKILFISKPTTINLRTKNHEPIELEVCDLLVENKLGKVKQATAPLNIIYFKSLLKYFSKDKDWVSYFNLKETLLDFRLSDSSTIHKSQGSTFDTTFLDLTDLSTCRNSATVARLLYVAFTRAQNRVVLFGSLSEKFGGIDDTNKPLA